MNQTTPANVAAAVERIRAILGPAGCLEAPEDIAPYLTDFRGLYRGATPLVACPASTADVAAVLSTCHALGVGVVPHGGNTSYCGGATPHEHGREIVLSLRRMDRVREVDADNFSMTVDAGCLLADVRGAAEAAGRFFPRPSAPRAAARSAATSRPTPAASMRCATAWRATSCSDSRSCSPTGGSSTGSPACARTTPATTCGTCSSAPRARSGSSPQRA
jgi:hypothetical protein